MPSHNILHSMTVNNHSSNSRQPNSMRPLFIDELCADGAPLPPLKIGDKVVWISDNGPEFGVVKWLGKLPDVGTDWMVGVDFVNSVGSGTGVYNDYQLFQTKMNHASLVPIVGLIKASDYAETGGLIEDFMRSSPPQKPKRTKKIENAKFYIENNENCQRNVCAKISNDLIDLKLNQDEQFYEKSPTNMENDLSKKENKLISVKKMKNSLFQSDDKKNVASFIPSSSNLSPLKENVFKNIESIQFDEVFEIGSVVKFLINFTSYYGVIRWLGFLKNDFDYGIESIRKSDKNFRNVIAGIELEEEIAGLTDGTLNGKRYFTCSINKAYFINLNECSKDEKFFSKKIGQNNESLTENKQNSPSFGSIDCPTVLGDVAPLTFEDLPRFASKNRGIQGHHNSCYLDATLFAMFSFSSIFESLLNRPKKHDDIAEYSEVQRILKEEIVNPLRSNLYVRADRVMRLRQLLEKISSVRGLTSEEKDPEEFINLLLNEILKTDPFLKLSSGLESFFYQLFIEKDENLQLPNVQQLFDQSFLASDIKLREVPTCLMIQMPRFGRDFKMYSKIMPSLHLDITNVLENSPRQCIICGQLAEVECKECFGKFGEGLDSIAFCVLCLEKTHNHKKRIKHKAIKLSIPPEFAMLKNHTNIPKVVMELFAVLCIETSHYVSFVKCGDDSNSPWCFFDSMADRKGEQNGYNIPEVVAFSNLKWWLSKEGYDYLINNDDKSIPELPRRLFSDAYICFYSSEVSRYR